MDERIERRTTDLDVVKACLTRGADEGIGGEEAHVRRVLEHPPAVAREAQAGPVAGRGEEVGATAGAQQCVRAAQRLDRVDDVLEDVDAVDEVDGRLPRRHLLDAAGVQSSANSLRFTCFDGAYTESLTLDDTEVTIQIMNDLKALGVTLSLDDFGTGFSSIARLRELPIDRVKLDRALTIHVAQREEARAIAQALVGLVHGLGCTAVAEGIESADQASAAARRTPRS